MHFNVRLYRTPFVIRRTITVERSLCTVLLDETIENVAEEGHAFYVGAASSVWASVSNRWISPETAAQNYVADDTEVSPSSRIAPSTTAHWPLVTGKHWTIDLGLIPPSEMRVTEFGYISKHRRCQTLWTGMSESVTFQWRERVIPKTSPGRWFSWPPNTAATRLGMFSWWTVA